MDPLLNPDQNAAELHARLDRLEAKLDDLKSRVGKSHTQDSGIGCFGVALFAWVLFKLYELQEMIQALPG